MYYSEGKQSNPRLRLVIPNKRHKSNARSLPRPNNFNPNQWQGHQGPETGIFNVIYDFISIVMSNTWMKLCRYSIIHKCVRKRF